MYVVDETSPRYGLGAEELEARQARVFLIIGASDAAIGAQVHDVHGFGPQQIRFGMRYTDAVVASEAGSLLPSRQPSAPPAQSQLPTITAAAIPVR
jgi:hypothetical protein